MTTDAEDIPYDRAPAALIFADDAVWRIDAANAVAEIGGRVVTSSGIAGAVERLAARIGDSVVLLNTGASTPAALDGVFDAIRRGAAGGHVSVVVTITPALIDVADARLGAEAGVTLLCEPSAVEQVAAIAAALRVPQARRVARDGASEGMVPRLQELSREAGRIADALAQLSALTEERPPVAMMRPAARGADRPVDAAQVRAIIRARRLRDQFFASELFADPAWDMLLDLTAARLEGRQVAVSSLCIAAAVPPTTALRWIKTLTDGGILERIADKQDGRRVFITLAPAAADAMLAFLAATQRLSGPAA